MIELDEIWAEEWRTRKGSWREEWMSSFDTFQEYYDDRKQYWPLLKFPAIETP